jgi:hypothetical protein
MTRKKRRRKEGSDQAKKISEERCREKQSAQDLNSTVKNGC